MKIWPDWKESFQNSPAEFQVGDFFGSGQKDETKKHGDYSCDDIFTCYESLLMEILVKMPDFAGKTT